MPPSSRSPRPVRRLARLALAFTLALGPAAAGAQRPAPTVAARLDSVARAYAARGELSGVVLVARDGRVVYERAFGEADRVRHVPNTRDTRFRIASTTKQFTAALVLRLVEDGMLRLDAPIAAYLPEYPRPQGDGIMLRQLLSHTAGLPDYPHLAGFYEHEVMTAHTPATLMALFDTLPLDFPPGSRWGYSNSDYVVLGAIVERVTGQPYAAALRARLLAPLGLAATAYDDGADTAGPHALGYVRDSSRVVDAPFIDPSTVYAAGMLCSTAGDLFRWAELLRRNAVFHDPATQRRMETPSVDTGLPLGGYGYGVFVGTQRLGGRAVRVVQHGGTINGFTTGFWRMPDEGAAVVVLDNTMSHSTPALTAALAAALFAR
jgi:CubicO group peptidase (beta-lactamase class C family)